MDIVGFITASIVLTLMPGPDILFVLMQGLTFGKRPAIAVSLGLSSGLLVHTTAAALGLSIVIANSPILFNIIKYAGVAYLIYMGTKAFMSRNKQQNLGNNTLDDISQQGFFQLYKRGIMMNLLNPKVIIFFLAFLPQFLNSSSLTPQYEIFTLGGLFALQAVIVFTTVSILAGIISNKLSINHISHKKTSIINAVIYWIIALLFLMP